MIQHEVFDAIDDVLVVFDLTPETALSMSTPTRHPDIDRGAELQRLAVKAAAEVMRSAERGMQALAREFGIDAGERWVHFDGFAVVTGLDGGCDDSRHEIETQLAGAAALLREIERRASAVTGRDIRIAFANSSRIELSENPAYGF